MVRGKSARELPKSVPAELREHVKTCSDSQCGCKLLAVHLQEWQAKLPIVTEEILGKLQEHASDKVRALESAMQLSDMTPSWLIWEISGGNAFAAGCRVCAKHSGMQFSKCHQMKFAKMLGHTRNQGHIEACCAAIGFSLPKKEIPFLTPTVKQFRQAYEHFQSGHRGTLNSVGARGKMDRMEFALVEAARQQWRQSLRQAVSVTLLRDERRKRLLICFRATDRKLQVVEGVLGQLAGRYSSTALGICAATLKVIREFCTPGMGNPSGKEAELECDEQLVEHIRHRAQAITVDAASNEAVGVQDSGAPLELPMTDYGLQAGDTIFPNLRLIVRDRAHGSRRVLERPWRADEFLEAVVVSLAQGPGSIVQMIQHSEDFREWYQALVFQRPYNT